MNGIYLTDFGEAKMWVVSRVRGQKLCFTNYVESGSSCDALEFKSLAQTKP